MVCRGQVIGPDRATRSRSPASVPTGVDVESVPWGGEEPVLCFQIRSVGVSDGKCCSGVGTGVGLEGGR